MRIAAFLLTAVILGIVQIVVKKPPMLLVERFLPGAGWVEIGLLALYAGFVAGKFSDPASAARWRPRIWRFFSLVFFAQLILGLSGIERCLMTGDLHLPVPALIVAGPVYRGGGYFMLILFLATILLVGPAWCSHLCYIGSWDDWASRARKRPLALPRWRVPARIGILILAVGTAFLLRKLGATPMQAGGVAVAFGLAGVGLMLLWSRRAGVMTHCVTYCPISLLANLLGKISPFRLRIDQECNDCTLCTRVCRYDALTEEDVRRRRPGITCTLCGDCLPSCKSKSLTYSLPGLGPQTARSVFIVMIISLHAAFLGLARL